MPLTLTHTGQPLCDLTIHKVRKAKKERMRGTYVPDGSDEMRVRGFRDNGTGGKGKIVVVWQQQQQEEQAAAAAVDKMLALSPFSYGYLLLSYAALLK